MVFLSAKTSYSQPIQTNSIPRTTRKGSQTNTHVDTCTPGSHTDSCIPHAHAAPHTNYSSSQPFTLLPPPIMQLREKRERKKIPAT
ncbi:hypothetical protein M440DRAFT_1402221 [Trichoderma longibrachiatum ATCC 18648]|uniref:Uncharacterized protein n=1 Tax=Trichoderma longibrachiatum ATCC 18648 TaxID=983965 RepID=A0A2T4C2B1_TRILO|nr:hypothetical protein M440DRAFT_1402221 [Trichoderma longibrachiatum ATCC 18648]